MQKILIPIVIFIAVLLTLMFGEGLFAHLFNLLENTLRFLWNSWHIFYIRVVDFVIANPYKILLALVITAIATVWLFKHHSDSINAPTNRRKLAIILAIFLGWLGVRRFYLRQYGLGCAYLIISLFIPITVLISFIRPCRKTSSFTARI